MQCFVIKHCVMELQRVPCTGCVQMFRSCACGKRGAAGEVQPLQTRSHRSNTTNNRILYRKSCNPSESQFQKLWGHDCLQNPHFNVMANPEKQADWGSINKLCATHIFVPLSECPQVAQAHSGLGTSLDRCENDHPMTPSNLSDDLCGGLFPNIKMHDSRRLLD